MKFEDLQNYLNIFKRTKCNSQKLPGIFSLIKKCKLAYSFVYANLLLSICSDFESLTRYCFDKRYDDLLEIEQIIELLENDVFYSDALLQKVKLDGYGEFTPFNSR